MTPGSQDEPHHPMEMLVGSGQPGRMKLVEDRVGTLERNDIRRSVYDRLVNAAITTALSVTSRAVSRAAV